MISLECENDRLVFQGPELKDVHSLRLGTNLKRSMDNTVYTYIKKPVQEKKFNLVNMTRDQATKLLEFLRKNYSKEIVYTEYFNLANPTKYKAKVTSPLRVIDQAINDSRTEIVLRLS